MIFAYTYEMCGDYIHAEKYYKLHGGLPKSFTEPHREYNDEYMTLMQAYDSLAGFSPQDVIHHPFTGLVGELYRVATMGCCALQMPADMILNRLKHYFMNSIRPIINCIDIFYASPTYVDLVGFWDIIEQFSPLLEFHDIDSHFLSLNRESAFPAKYSDIYSSRFKIPAS